ncbi:MAG: TatD family hydrolase [Verrucomicrobiota bacterium]
MVTITDTHCHLASAQFADYLPEVVQRAREAGVHRLVTIGTDLQDSKLCLKITEKFEGVFATVGVHPCSVFDVEDADWKAQLRELAQHDRVAAIGEIGLDYFHPPPEGHSEVEYRERQKDFFIQQLELAAELDLNVVIHQRDKGDECWQDLLKMMRPFSGRLRAVFHCFTHSWEEALKVVNEGHLISFTGIVTFKNAAVIHDCAKNASPGQFMIETDAPYLAPEPFRGKRCEPAYTAKTLQRIAEIRKESEVDLAEKIEDTVKSFFRLQ